MTEPTVPSRQEIRPKRTENTLGIAYMAGGMFLFSAVDTQAKFLTETLHPIQIVWSRQLGLLVGVLVLLSLRGISILHTRRPGLQIARGVLAASSATLFIFAISYVPLADAVAVSFVAPLIVTILGAVALREPVGLRRWIAVTLGFIGTVIIIRPGSGLVHPAVFLVLLAALFFALRQIFSRTLGGSDEVQTTVAYTAIVGSLVLSLPLPFVWHWPGSPSEILLLISIAIMAGVAEVLVIKSLEVAQAVVVAPVHYSLLIWGTMYGYLIFGQFPDFWAWIGAAIIVTSGLYTLQRERRVSPS